MTDTEEPDMSKMTITHDALADKAKHYGLPELAAANFVAALGITIAPAEPRAEMVKAADDAWKALPASIRNLCGERSWQEGFVCGLQYAAEKARGLPTLDRIAVALTNAAPPC